MCIRDRPDPLPSLEPVPDDDAEAESLERGLRRSLMRPLLEESDAIGRAATAMAKARTETRFLVNMVEKGLGDDEARFECRRVE